MASTHQVAGSTPAGGTSANDRAATPAWFWSGRRDSNPRPPAPKAGALTKLRYSPCASNLTRAGGGQDQTLRSQAPADSRPRSPHLVFSKDPIHFGAAAWAGPLSSPPAIRQIDFLAVKFPLVATLHAVAVIRGHPCPPTECLCNSTSQGLYLSGSEVSRSTQAAVVGQS